MFAEIARRMDIEIHKGYRIYAINYVALDLLNGSDAYAGHYTAKDKQRFDSYIQSRIELIDLPEKDEVFLREKMLQMYANPLINHLKAIHAQD